MPKKTNMQSNEEAKKRENARAHYAKKNGVFDNATGSYKIVKDSGKSEKGDKSAAEIVSSWTSDDKNNDKTQEIKKKASDAVNGVGKTVKKDDGLSFTPFQFLSPRDEASRRNMSRDENSKVNIPLATSDGKMFGNVSRNAINAIKNGTLNSYVPVSMEEHRSLSRYVTTPMISLETESGQKFGNVSYMAYDAVVNNRLGKYVPYNDEEKESLKKYNEYFYGVAPERIEGLSSDVATLEKIFETAKKYKDNADWYIAQSAIVGKEKGQAAEKAYLDYLKSVGYKSVDDIAKALGEKRTSLKKMEMAQKNVELSSVSDPLSAGYDKDFNKKSTYNPEKVPFITIGTGSQIYEYINGDDASKAKYAYENEYAIYDEMTDKEVSLYNYYYNEFGKGKAAEYLKTIEEELHRRSAQKSFDKIKGSRLSEMLYIPYSGLNQFVTGVKNAFNTSDDYIPYNTGQILSGMISEDIPDGTAWQVAFDLGTSVFNMAPSIAAGIIHPLAGAALMGVSSAGGTYQEAINSGMDKTKARIYSSINGFSEAGLQYLLGGIGKLGGELSGNFLSKIALGIDNAAARFAVEYSGKVASEFFEESLQSVLEPFFENLVLGYAKNENVDWSEVAYSGMLGALTAGFLEGPSVYGQTFAANNSAKKIGADIKENGNVSSVLKIVSESPAGSDASNLYTLYKDRGINENNISDLQLGRLQQFAKEDAKTVLNNEKSSDKERFDALSRFSKLSASTNENSVKKDDVYYLIDENFEQNYDKWVSKGKRDGVVLTVGRTSEALKSIGVKEQSVTWDTSNINRSLNEHSYLDDNIMKQIPSLIENPIIVMQSKKSDSRITMFGEVYDRDGLPIMTVLELLPTNLKGNAVLDVIKITSTHSRKSSNPNKPADITQTQSMIDTSDILYVEPNKNRTDNWLVANRLQLPLHITNYGSIKSVTYPNGNVNTYGMQDLQNNKGNVSTNDDYLTSIADEGVETVKIAPETEAKLRNYEKVLQRFGFKVVYESHRVTPDKTIGYVDFTNKEVYLSPEHIDEVLLTHELTHIIDRGSGGKYVESLVSFFKKELSDDWNEKHESVKAKYEEIAEENPGFTYNESTLLAETLAEMCSEFTTDEYIKKAASMDVGTIKQIGLMLRYIGYKIKMLFGDESSAHKMKMASLKWQLALYRATNKGDVDGGSGVSFSVKEIKGDSGINYGIGVFLDSNLLTGLTENERKQMVREYVISELAGGRFIAYDSNNVAVEIGIADKNARVKNAKGRSKRVVEELYRKNIDTSIKQEAVVLADELIQTAKYKNSLAPTYSHDWIDNNGKNDWDYWKVYIQEKNKSVWEATLNIANTANGEKILYDIDPIKMVEQAVKSATSTTNYSISNSAQNVNKNFLENDDISFSIATDEGSVKDVQPKKNNAGIDALKYYQKNADELLEERDTLEYLLREGDLDVDERLAAKTKIHLIDKALSGKSKYVEDMVRDVPDKELTGKAKKVAETVRAYRETGDAREADKLPTKRSLKVSEKYRQGKIAEINRELNQLIRERNQDGVTDVQREELDVQINDRFAQLREIAKINEVYKQAYDILDEIDTAARPNHTWVGEISEWLADKKNLIKYGTYNLNDIERNFKIFFGEHFKKAYDKIIQPLYDSKKAYTEGVTEYANRLKKEIVDGLGIKKGSKASAAVMWLGEGQKPISKKAGSDLAPYTYRDCEAEFGAERAKDIKKAAEIFREMYDELLDKVNETRAMLYPNNPDKLIPRREDYFRHFQEMSQGFEGLRNILSTNIGIDPMLVGVSENTKPKSKRQSFAQSRMGNRTEYDAVGGFLDYLPAAMYSTHIDPNIVNVRSLAYDLASAKAEENGGSGNPNANGFIAYLQRYANSLAGKTTSHFDRAVQDSNFGRTAMAIVSWLNNKTKASAVLGNINSVLSQVTNIKNVIGKIEHQSDVVRGALDALAGLNSSGRVAKRYEDSGFLKERYIDRVFSQFDRGWDKVNPVKWAADVLGYADEIGTRITWNAGYNEAVRKGVSNPVQYADNFTRSCVAGRGIGEEALVFKSQVAKMFLPFRTEVLNDLRVQQDILFGEEYDIWEKNAGNITDKKNMVRVSKEVDGIFDGSRSDRQPIILGDTPKLLRDYGAGNNPLTVNVSTVMKMAYPKGYLGLKDGHNLGISAVKHLSEQIESPLAILKSNSQDNSLVILTEWEDENGNRVVVPVHLDKNGRLGISNEIASAYGKGNIDSLVFDKSGKSNVLYTKNNKSIDALVASSGLQLPRVPSEDTLINYSISQNAKNINKNVSTEYDAFDEIVAMGKADGKKIKTNTARRVKNMMQLYIASMVVNAVIAAIKSDEFEPIEEAKEGYEEDGVLGALLSVMEDYADGIGDPVAFDPIYDIASGIYQGIEEGESAGGDVGRAVLRTAQNLSGDLVSNNPFSTAVMGMVGFDNDASELLFNGNVYVPGGMGMPLASNAATVMRELGQGDYASAAAATVKPFLPLGTQADRSAKGLYEWSKGYATTESAYDRMAGQEGDLKYLIEKNPENFIKSLLFGPGAFSGESDAYYNDKTRKFSDEEQAKILSQPDYKSRKVTFDDILAMNKYDSERDERKQSMADEFFQGKEGTILHNLYVSGEDAAIPYKNMAGESSFTDSKTGRQYTLALSASDAEKLTKEVNDKIAERFNRANGSDVFALMSKDEQVKYLEAVANAEYKQAKIKALYESGQMGYEDYFRLESNYIETEAKRDRVLYVDDTSAYVEFNAADTVGQYISYSDAPVSEEGYEQITQWRNYASTRKADDVDRELMRLSNATGSDINVSGNPYGIISYSKNKVEYRIELPDNQIYALCDEVDRAVRSALLALFSKATYKNAIDEVKKDMVASVKRSARDKIKDKYKAKYKSIKVDEFDKIINMK